MIDGAQDPCVVDYDRLDPSDDVAAIRQAYLQLHGEAITESALMPYAEALAAGRASRLALVLELVDAVRVKRPDVVLRFDRKLPYYLPRLAAQGSGESWTPIAVTRVVDLSELDRLDDEAFLRSCYLRVLGKPGDPEGLAYYRHLLQTGSTRLDVLSAHAAAAAADGEAVTFQMQADALGRFGRDRIARLSELLGGSPEDCIHALYRVVLGKAADAGGLAHYLWQLSIGRSRLSVYAELRAIAVRDGRHVTVDCDLDEAGVRLAV